MSKYNAIYGSFAALPLLLLWLQLSWLICLFGAEISYASQNVKKFSFERDSKNISRRYKDFLTLLIASLIVKRFVKGEKPYTADELSDAYRIPIRITTQILYQLTELHIIIEVNYGDDERVVHYQPGHRRKQDHGQLSADTNGRIRFGKFQIEHVQIVQQRMESFAENPRGHD